MTTATIILDGKRGKKYRLCISQNDPGLGAGVVYRLQEQRTSKRLGTSWHDVAGCIEPSNDMTSRVIAGWLTTPMPSPRVPETRNAAVRGPIEGL